MTQQPDENPKSEYGWNRYIVATIGAAALVGVANVVATAVAASSNNGVERTRADSSLILEMVKGQSPEQSAKNLKFIIDAGLISKKETREALIEALGSSSLPGVAFLPYGSELPEPPASLRQCAAKGTIEIPDGSATKAEVASLLASMRTSELDKDRCADNWEAWYNSLLNINAGPDS